MTANELALLLSPIAAIIVAFATVLFNIVDRRRHYSLEREKLRLEREKLSQEMAKALLSGSKSLEKRIELYNDLMQTISEISSEAQAKCREAQKGTVQQWSPQFFLDKLDKMHQLLRGNQAFTTKFVHESITRGYSLKVAGHTDRISAELNGAAVSSDNSSKTLLLCNLLTQIVAFGDNTKQSIRDDLELFVRGLTRMGE